MAASENPGAGNQGGAQGQGGSFPHMFSPNADFQAPGRCGIDSPCRDPPGVLFRARFVGKVPKSKGFSVRTRVVTLRPQGFRTAPLMMVTMTTGMLMMLRSYFGRP